MLPQRLGSMCMYSASHEHLRVHVMVDFSQWRQVSYPKEAISVLKLTTASDLHLACCRSARAAGAHRDTPISACACMPRWISLDGGRFQDPKKPFLS